MATVDLSGLRSCGIPDWSLRTTMSCQCLGQICVNPSLRKHTPQADPNLSKQNIKSWAAPATHLQLIAHRRPLPCCDLDLRAWVLTLLLFQLRGIHSHQINVRDSSEVPLQQMKSHQSVK